MTGGLGGDVFVIGIHPGEVDIIKDFNPEEGDKIDLSAFAGELRTSVDLRSELVNGGTLMYLPDGQAVLFEGLLEDFPEFNFQTPFYFTDNEVTGLAPANVPDFAGFFVNETVAGAGSENAGVGAGAGASSIVPNTDAGAGSENAGIGTVAFSASGSFGVSLTGTDENTVIKHANDNNGTLLAAWEQRVAA